MLTRSFQGDIFSFNTMAKDLSILYKHGYCLDLSSSSIISEAIARMHPAIAQQVMFDGGIYGIQQFSKCFGHEATTDTAVCE